MRIAHCLLGLILLTSSAARAGERPVAVPLSDARLHSIRSEILGKVQRGELVSASVGVIANGRIVWSESLGFADREALLRASPATRYGIASVGKSITATAVMTLVERGHLRLDEPISVHTAPSRQKNVACGKAPTPRHVLSMTAGIPHGAATYFNAIPLPEVRLERAWSTIVFCPGEVFHYSNFSFAMADALIEDAARLPFAEYLQAAVFLPLRMRGAALGTPPGYAPPAARYDAEGRRLEAATRLPRSSRQMNASLDDLLQYAAYNLKTRVAGQKSILSSKSLDEMHLARPKVAGAITALGWGSNDLPTGGRWLISNGNDQGVQAVLVLVPHSRVGVVILTNSSGYQLDELAIRAADALAPGVLAGFETARGAYEGSRKAIDSEPGWLGEWRGEVLAPQGAVPLRLVVENGRTSIALADGGAVELRDASLFHGLLTGNFSGVLALEEKPEGQHFIDVSLRRNGQVATGFVTANFATRRGKYELPAAVRLRRATKR